MSIRAVATNLAGIGSSSPLVGLHHFTVLHGDLCKAGALLFVGLKRSLPAEASDFKA